MSSSRRANARSQSTWRGRGRGGSNRGQRCDLHGRGSGRNDGPVHDSNFKQKHQTARQSLEYLPSISRSGGQGGHGDTLKQNNVQNEYWETIQSKLADHWKKQYQMQDSLRKENESNLLLHLRKLREGILSSKREDNFALTVYEASFYLAIVFDSPVQIAASQSHLIQLFQVLRQPSDFSSSSLHRKATAFSVTSSLLSLAEAYPSQNSYYRNLEAIGSLPQSPNDKVDTDCLGWISSLRSSLNTRNYVQSQRLTSSSRVNSIIEELTSPESSDKGAGRVALDDLLGKVVFKLVDSLLEKLRESAWQIMRAAYRELTVSSVNKDDLANSAWTGRALFFHVDESESDGSKSVSALEIWVKQKVNEGELVEKTGVDGRWLICRNKK